MTAKAKRPEEPAKPLVPAHPPSKADPVAAVVGLIVALAALAGIPLSKYVDAETLATIVGFVMTAGAGFRAWYQRRVAKLAAGS